MADPWFRIVTQVVERIKNLEAALREANADRLRFSAINRDLHEDLKKSKHAYSHAEGERHAAVARINNFQRVNSELRDTLTCRAAEVVGAREELRQATEKNQILLDCNERQGKMISNLINEVAELKKCHGHQRTTIQDQRKEIETLKEQIKAMKETSPERITATQIVDGEWVRLQNESLRARIERLNELLAAQEKELNQLRPLVRRYVVELQKAQMKLASIRKAFETVKGLESEGDF